MGLTRLVTIVADDGEGRRAAAAALADGRPVAVAGRPPRAFAVVATDPAAVNQAKRRPADQPVGVGIAGIDAIAEHLALDPSDLALARWLSEVQELSLHAPVGPAAPAWMAPATVEGRFLFAAAWHDGMGGLLADRGHLYMSSANLTQTGPARTASEAEAAFEGELLVLDDGVDAARASDRGSTTVIALAAGGEMELVRSGVNDRDAPGPDAFLLDLRSRWHAYQLG